MLSTRSIGIAPNPSQGVALYTDGVGAQSCNAVAVDPVGRVTALSGQGCPAESSVFVVDCCGLEWVDQSTWDPDGDGLVRQSVALTPCTASLFNSQLGPATYASRCGPPILFADGFESGDASAWSLVVP